MYDDVLIFFALQIGSVIKKYCKFWKKWVKGEFSEATFQKPDENVHSDTNGLVINNNKNFRIATMFVIDMIEIKLIVHLYDNSV